jgi:hypothetical protein
VFLVVSSKKNPGHEKTEESKAKQAELEVWSPCIQTMKLPVPHSLGSEKRVTKVMLA